MKFKLLDRLMNIFFSSKTISTHKDINEIEIETKTENKKNKENEKVLFDRSEYKDISEYSFEIFQDMFSLYKLNKNLIENYLKDINLYAKNYNRYKTLKEKDPNVLKKLESSYYTTIEYLFFCFLQKKYKNDNNKIENANRICLINKINKDFNLALLKNDNLSQIKRDLFLSSTEKNHLFYNKKKKIRGFRDAFEDYVFLQIFEKYTKTKIENPYNGKFFLFSEKTDKIFYELNINNKIYKISGNKNTMNNFLYEKIMFILQYLNIFEFIKINKDNKICTIKYLYLDIFEFQEKENGEILINTQNVNDLLLPKSFIQKFCLFFSN